MLSESGFEQIKISHRSFGKPAFCFDPPGMMSHAAYLVYERKKNAAQNVTLVEVVRMQRASPPDIMNSA